MRIAVVGTSGAGKSTFASMASKKLAIKHIDQDYLHWEPNWKEVPKEQFKKSLLKEIKDEAWVICGNYSSTQEHVWARATHIVWLNYPLRTCLWRAFQRTVKRVFLKQPCCNGNFETFRHAFLSKDSVLRWILVSYKKTMQRYNNIKQVVQASKLNFIEFKSPRQAAEWVKKLDDSHSLFQ